MAAHMPCAHHWALLAVLAGLLAAAFLSYPNLSVSQGAAAVSKLVLSPTRAQQATKDGGLTLTVHAQDSSGKGVAGVTVAFSASGDCSPSLAHDSVVTDRSGRASTLVSTNRLGGVAVVAAATTGGGVPLVTPASHVIFFEDQEYAVNKERDWFSGVEGPQYGASADAGLAPATDSDAAMYATDATKWAIALLHAAQEQPAAAVSAER